MKKKTTAETDKEVQKTTVKVSEKKTVAPKSVMNGLTAEQVEILKTKILDEKNNLIFKNVYESDEFNLSNEDRSDEVDQANADVNNASRLRFRNREVFYAKKLDEALRRLQAGEYGQCGECDCNISFQRLYARPTAEMCISCKEEAERDESNNFIDRQSKSLGKAIDLVQSIA
ncbi:MAG: TraR/DksA family transcriptional regulator [Bacteriovoracaceae bacterium]